MGSDTIFLPTKDYERFLDVCNNPQKPKEALIELFREPKSPSAQDLIEEARKAREGNGG